MEDEKLLNITSSIEEKIGKDAAATIADDLGVLMTENAATQKIIEGQAEKIKELQDRNDKLVLANGNLLQQIPMVKEVKNDKEESSDKTISLRDAFDSKGNFIH